MKVDSRSSH